MILVLWIEGVFSHDSGVCHFVYGVWGGYRRALPFPPPPPLFLCVVPLGTYLNDGEDIGILVEFASCFVNQI